MLTKEAAGNNALVAGDITMTGKQLYPIGELYFEELVEIYKEQIRCMVKAGVDLLVAETIMSLQEARAAVLAAKEVCDLPIMVTMTFQEDGRTLYGTDPKTALIVLQSLGADAVGVNCSAGPDAMISIIEEMKKYAVVPLIAKPNAGLPKIDENGKNYFDMDADTFADFMEKLAQAGAAILGGCCGTTPEYIKKIKVHGDGEGLLQHHMDAVLQGIDGAGGMLAVVGADADRIQVLGLQHGRSEERRVGKEC